MSGPSNQTNSVYYAALQKLSGGGGGGGREVWWCRVHMWMGAVPLYSWTRQKCRRHTTKHLVCSELFCFGSRG